MIGTAIEYDRLPLNIKGKR